MRLLLATCLLLGGEPAVADEPAPSSGGTTEAPGQTMKAIETTAGQVRSDWKALRETHERPLLEIERARRDPAAWARLGAARRTLHERFEAQAAPLFAAFPNPATLADHAARPLPAGAADILVEVIHAWLAIGEPPRILATLEARPAVLAALARHDDAQARRALLDRVATRVAATPDISDLEALAHVIAWDAPFAAQAALGDAQLESVTTDLVLLFTERAADGITVASSSLYRAGRFADTGFADAYRDGSDQVRHLAWALRMFARSGNPDATAALLRMKEQSDAHRRSAPLNQKDIALIAPTRAVIKQILGGDGAAPVPAREYADLIRRTFGTSPQGKAVTEVNPGDARR